MNIAKLIAPFAAATLSLGAAAEWPDKPIHVVVPFTAGSGTDIVARTVFEPVGRALGQPIVIENKPGAGGTLGAVALASTGKPDGYLIAQMPITVFRFPHMQKTQFDPAKDIQGLYRIAYVSRGISLTQSRTRCLPQLLNDCGAGLSRAEVDVYDGYAASVEGRLSRTRHRSDQQDQQGDRRSEHSPSDPIVIKADPPCHYVQVPLKTTAKSNLKTKVISVTGNVRQRPLLILGNERQFIGHAIFKGQYLLLVLR